MRASARTARRSPRKRFSVPARSRRRFARCRTTIPAPVAAVKASTGAGYPNATASTGRETALTTEATDV